MLEVNVKKMFFKIHKYINYTSPVMIKDGYFILVKLQVGHIIIVICDLN